MSIMHQFNDEDNRPDFVKPGKYAATIVDAEEKISKSSGNEMIELEWELDQPAPHIWDYLTFSAKMAWKIDTFLKSIGKQPKKGEEVKINAEDLVGLRAFIHLEIEDDNRGSKRNRVIKYITDKHPEALPTEEASKESAE